MNDDEMIELLLKKSGKRLAPPRELAEEIKLATKDEWRKTVRSDVKRTRLQYLQYVAASIFVFAVGVFTLTQSFGPEVSNEHVAQISKSYGSISLNDVSLGESEAVSASDVLTTGVDSQVSLQLLEGIRIVLDSHTTVQFVDNDSLRLLAGRLYFDSEGNSTPVDISTTWGKVTDIGTQYLLSIENDQMAVAVREGIVEVDLGDNELLATTQNGLGDVITVNRNGNLKKGSISSTDKSWSWARKTQDALEIEGMSVYELLIWSGRVTGRDIGYTNADVEDLAKSTILSGGKAEPESLENYLADLLQTTTLSADFSDSEIVIFER